jgi:maltokinase
MTRLQTLTDVLGDWLPLQRWFGGKGRPIHGLQIVSSSTVRPGDPSLEHVIVAVDHGEDVERYQLLVGLRDEVPQRLEHAVIGRLADTTAYDAAHDVELTAYVLGDLAAALDVGPLHFRTMPDADIKTGASSRVLPAEQSNTSLVFGDDYIFKLFRKVSPGINPDLEITRALAEAGSSHIAPPLGWMESDLDGEPTTLAMMQPFLRSATEGWAMATTSVRDLYAEEDLHANEVGGDFAAEAMRLGAATAEVHALMRDTLPAREAAADEIAALAKHMHERLDAALAVAPALEVHAAGLRTAFEDLARWERPVLLQRIHGDYHLGQVLRTDAGWVLLDFEGEPARPLAGRRSLRRPLRDVAGMLRSFAYAARHRLADLPGRASLEYRAVEWAERNRDAFCDGYAQSSGEDPRADSVLLRAFELDKAVYEVVYEARNRPLWLPIPLASIERLVS